VDLTPYQRQDFEEALRDAQTVLENLFWGWLLGHVGCDRLYFEELMISELDGPGDEPDNTPGVES
jgi:hypothetical protein